MEKEDKLDKLLEQFKQKFPVDSLQNMTLEQYTDIKQDEKDNDSFTYWVERKTRDLGSIQGRVAKKFNIYKFKKKPKDNELDYDELYAWKKKLGVSKEEVWNKTRQMIYDIAKLSVEGKFSEIDEINDIEPVYKWKIAFLYSDKKILNIFKYDVLLFLAKKSGQEYPSTKNNFNEIYSFLLAKKESTEDFWNYSENLWKDWSKSQERFKVVFQELKDELENNNDFLYCPKDGDGLKGNSKYIWIGTRDKLIGDKKCHYEYIFHDNKLSTEVHFEDSKTYSNLRTICNKKLEQYPRKSKRYYLGKEYLIDIDKDDDYIEKAIDALYKLDVEIGKELREVLIKMNNKSEIVTECKALLENTHNLILHGAPGTGKTFLAKEMGCSDAEIGFVQFHPSYDYTDFVEGVRPIQGENDQVGFEKKDGIFKKFCSRALRNLNDSEKKIEELQSDQIFDTVYNFLLNDIEDGKISTYPTTKGDFEVYLSNTKQITFEQNSKWKKYVREDYLRALFNDIKDDDIDLLKISREKLDEIVSKTTNIKHVDYIQYRWTLHQLVLRYKEHKKNLKIKKIIRIEKKPFVFIIDEINRGELSKIFGELFYSIDPGYRVDISKITSTEKPNTILTQYANMEKGPNDFDVILGEDKVFGHFFVPSNIYIIGTMNDIDRNVESFDFAFRRRFTFKEIKATDTFDNIIQLNPTDKKTVRKKMDSLNKAIEEIGFSCAYHIGGAYFKKLETFTGSLDEKLKKLWDYHLKGLLREYLRGMEDVKDKLDFLQDVYNKAKEE